MRSMTTSSQLEVPVPREAPSDAHVDLPAPILKLLPEVLFAIFLRVAGHNQVTRAASWHRRSRVPVQEWIHITHVCAHWRQVALQCAALWSDLVVPGFSEAMLTEFLVRSKDAPLSVAVTFRLPDAADMGLRQPTEGACLAALSALHRVKTLVMDASRGRLPSNAVLQRLRGCTPLLESLTILDDYEDAKLSLRSATSHMLSYPGSCRLTSLAAGFHAIAWGSASFDRLTSLKLRGDNKPFGPTVESFLKALSCMPYLDDLELDYALSHPNFASWGDWLGVFPPPPAALTRLKRLRIYLESPLVTTALLTSFHMPSLRHLDVTVYPELGQNNALRAVLLQKASTLGPFLTVRFQHASYLCAYRDPCERTADPRDDNISTWLEEHEVAIKYSVEYNPQSTLITDLCSILPLQDVKTLITGCSQLPREDEWHMLARCMEALTDLRIHLAMPHSGPVCFPLGEVLRLRRGAGDGDRPAPFAFPRLRALIMDKYSFDDPSHVDGRARVIAQLRAGFAERAQEGAGIEVLRIPNSRYFTEDDLESLREVVPCVESGIAY